MTIYQYTDPAAEEMLALFWSLVPVIAEQAGVTEADAVFHIRRAWADKLKALKFTEGIDYKDDGRSAAWRVRLMIWRLGERGQEELYADSDAGAQFDQYNAAPGSTVIYGLPAVAEWVRELCTQAHAPGSLLDGLDQGTLGTKIKSLRVALSNAGGRSTWRLRYTVAPPRTDAAPVSANALRDVARHAPTSQRFMATVDVQREESPRGK